MKIAVLVYGPLREFKIAKKSWGIFEFLDSDFYFSTWDKSIQKHSQLNINIEEDITEKDILNIYPNAKIKIHNESKFKSSNVNCQWDNNIEKMIFHWKYGLKMIEESDIGYDILILLRSDLYINYPKEKETLLKMNQDRTVYGVGHITITSINKTDGDFDYFVNDVFLMGNINVMSNVIKSCSMNYNKSIHNLLAKDILKLGYYVDVIDSFSCVPVRPNSRTLSENDINFFNLKNKHIEFDKTYKL
jgi:hypothetical protein